jgi:uncharacterized protein YndB with AHSA1/START domain
VPNTFGVVETRLEITIAATPSRLWTALVDETTHWWPKDYYTNPNTKRFVIEPKLGGKVFEDWGDGAGLMWYTVVGIDPPRTLRLAGNLFPEYGGPANCLLHIGIETNEKGTLLKICDSVVGKSNADCGTSLAEGWKLLFGSFKAYVERE